jgi:hypothetical protein
LSQEETIRTSGLEGWKVTVEIASFGGSKSSYSAAMGDVCLCVFAVSALLLKREREKGYVVRRQGNAVKNRNDARGIKE